MEDNKKGELPRVRWAGCWMGRKQRCTADRSVLSSNWRRQRVVPVRKLKGGRRDEREREGGLMRTTSFFVGEDPPRWVQSLPVR